jgi:hypothetical protein
MGLTLADLESLCENICDIHQYLNRKHASSKLKSLIAQMVTEIRLEQSEIMKALLLNDLAKFQYALEQVQEVRTQGMASTDRKACQKETK